MGVNGCSAKEGLDASKGRPRMGMDKKRGGYGACGNGNGIEGNTDRTGKEGDGEGGKGKRAG